MNREILLKIEKPDKTAISVKAHENDLVSNVLQTLQHTYSVSPKYSLVFRFKELAPSRSLKSYLIGTESRGASLHLGVFEKRDVLKKIEQSMQRFWSDEKVFQVDASSLPGEKKFMATFPFPYMNGLLHCGHGFSLSKAEFACGFQRLLGKQTLFPFGFHATGMPIVASAQKLRNEIQSYGSPPKFPGGDSDVSPISASQAADQPKVKKKGKLEKKKSTHLFQYEIMREIGVPEEEISQFTDPLKWINYFTPKGCEHILRFGCKVDMRRSFITTDINPFFSRFVEWQFNHLKKKNLLRFGKRMCVYSPLDQQPCADHDRSTGEGVQPQEYTVIKMGLVFPETSHDLAAKIEQYNSKRIFLVAGTLRPETMYGQTNCFVKPNGDYILLETVSEHELYICSEHSARNMSFQGITKTRGEVKVFARLKGWDLLGAQVRAPNSVHDRVYVLPLLNISMAKATGIVTSVPSDSPDDYINYIELQKNKAYREKYKISEEMVRFDIVPIIDIPGQCDKIAEVLCRRFNVKSPADEKNLKQAKDEAYLKGFYQGVLLAGSYKGEPVENAKIKIKNDLIAAENAFIYFEPAENVVSRSGDICVVAETDQWFLHYGEEPFKSEVFDYIKQEMEFYSEPTRDRFLETVLWMKQWACSRKFGLGTKLPFDKEWLIESLSDSTIYMAYYTIAHFFDSKIDTVKSDKKLDLEPADLTDEVFDAIFLGEVIPKNIRISEKDIAQMRKEFEYWYPLDLRVSGKDLINNHLVMSIYNHAFMWPKAIWPRSMYANGHAMINAEKMSKSTGNFMTLIECIEQYGADATRIAFADAGDYLDDANFAPETCNAAIIRLTKELSWITDAARAIGLDGISGHTEIKTSVIFSESQEKGFPEEIFENQINQAVYDAERAYSSMKFRVALNKGFYSMCSARSGYIAMCGENGLNREIVEKYIRSIIIVAAPICSHWSEHLWRVTGNEGSIFKVGRWPQNGPVDALLMAKSNYLTNFGHSVRIAYKDEMKLRSKGSNGALPCLHCCVFVASSHPSMNIEIMKITSFVLEERIKQNSKADVESWDSDAFSDFSQTVLVEIKRRFSGNKNMMKEAMMFSSFLLKEMKEIGKKALNMNKMFEEKHLIEEHWELVLKDVSLKFASFAVADVAELVKFDEESVRTILKSKVTERVLPGKIGVLFSKQKLCLL